MAAERVRTHHHQRVIAGEQYVQAVDSIHAYAQVWGEWDFQTRRALYLSSNFYPPKDRTIEHPALPFAVENPYYNAPLRDIKILYRQIPTVIVIVNAASIPQPFRPSSFRDGKRIPPTYTNGAVHRRSPFVSGFNKPWLPFTPADPTPSLTIDVRSELALRGPGRYELIPATINRLSGPGSQLDSARNRLLPFIQSMGRARMFRHFSRHTGELDNTMLQRRLVDIVDPGRIKERLGNGFMKPQDAIGTIDALNYALAELIAMDEYALRFCLDACAVLGGVELPVWPADARFQGAWGGPQLPLGTGVNEDYILQCRIRALERWGVPLWFECPHQRKERFEVMKGQFAQTGCESEEREYQKRLRGIHENRDWGRNRLEVEIELVVVVTNKITRPEEPKGRALLPEERQQLQDAIVSLVDPHARDKISFARFSQLACRLLGEDVWSGKRYEEKFHSKVSYEKKAGSRWLQIRDGIHECGHMGALYAAFEIPPLWSDPARIVLNEYHPATATAVAPRSAQVIEESVPASTWHFISIAGYSEQNADVEKSVRGDVRALGSRFILSKTQNKNEAGQSIKRSRYELELVFKSVRMQGEAVEKLNSTLASGSDLHVSAWAANNMDFSIIFNYSMSIDPYYLQALFEQALPSSRREALLTQGPRYNVPRSISRDKDATDARNDADRAYINHLCHFSIFEADTAFPPRFKSVSGASGESALDSHTSVSQVGDVRSMAKLPLAQLVQIAFSTSPNDLLLQEVVALQRLALILLACRRRGHFSSELFPALGSPYPQVLRYIAGIVRQSTDLPFYEFQDAARRAKLGPWSDQLRMSNDQGVSIFVNLDAPPPHHASKAAYDRYVERCAEEKVLLSSEKRKRRKGAKGPAASTVE